MSSKRCKKTPVFVKERQRESVSQNPVTYENIEKIKAFRAVHAHFSESRKTRTTPELKEYSTNPVLEIRLAMQQAKSSYDSMLDIQEKLNQAYYDIMKNPS